MISRVGSDGSTSLSESFLGETLGIEGRRAGGGVCDGEYRTQSTTAPTSPMSTKSGHVFSSGSWSTLIAEGPVHDLRPSAHSYSDGCSVGTGLLDHIGSTKVRGSASGRSQKAKGTWIPAWTWSAITQTDKHLTRRQHGLIIRTRSIEIR